MNELIFNFLETVNYNLVGPLYFGLAMGLVLLMIGLFTPSEKEMFVVGGN